MENKEDSNTPKSSAEQKKTPVQAKKKPQKGYNDDFKRKYFDYYDDIKISDRQDW